MVDCVFEDRDALLPRLAVDGTNPFFPEYVLSFVDCGIVVGDVQPKRVGSIQALVTAAHEVRLRNLQRFSRYGICQIDVVTHLSFPSGSLEYRPNERSLS